MPVTTPSASRAKTDGKTPVFVAEDAGHPGKTGLPLLEHSVQGNFDEVVAVFIDAHAILVKAHDPNRFRYQRAFGHRRLQVGFRHRKFLFRRIRGMIGILGIQKLPQIGLRPDRIGLGRIEGQFEQRIYPVILRVHADFAGGFIAMKRLVVVKPAAAHGQVQSSVGKHFDAVRFNQAVHDPVIDEFPIPSVHRGDIQLPIHSLWMAISSGDEGWPGSAPRSGTASSQSFSGAIRCRRNHLRRLFCHNRTAIPIK